MKKEGEAEKFLPLLYLISSKSGRGRFCWKQFWQQSMPNTYIPIWRFTACAHMPENIWQKKARRRSGLHNTWSISRWNPSFRICICRNRRSSVSPAISGISDLWRNVESCLPEIFDKIINKSTQIKSTRKNLSDEIKNKMSIIIVTQLLRT